MIPILPIWGTFIINDYQNCLIEFSINPSFDLISEIYGFVYLFKIIENVENLYKTEEYTPVKNPSNVYFANQVREV